MTATVRLEPSQRTFTVETGETILHAGLRAGVSLPHGCTQGNCGECRATVLSGQCESLGFHDYVLGASAQAAGDVLMCRAGASSDLRIQVAHASSVADLPAQHLPLKVRQIERVSPNVAEISLKVQRGKVFRFLAGQSARFRSAGGEESELALASCPCDGSMLRVYQSLQAPAPAFAALLESFERNGAARPGLREGQFSLEGPTGNFVLDEHSRRPLVFLAAGLGFAAVNSLIEHAMNLELPQPIALYRLADNPDEHYLHNHCRAMADAWDEFTYRHLDPGLLGTTGESSESGVRHFVRRLCAEQPGLGAADIYACLPAQEREAARRLLVDAGADAARIFMA